MIATNGACLPYHLALHHVQKLPGNQALTTGLRVVDAILPSVLGGPRAAPGVSVGELQAHVL